MLPNSIIFAFLLCSKSGLIMFDNHAIMLPNFVTTATLRGRQRADCVGALSTVMRLLAASPSFGSPSAAELLGVGPLVLLQALLSLSRCRPFCPSTTRVSCACAVLLPIQPKTGYYARIMLGGFNDLFCSKFRNSHA